MNPKSRGPGEGSGLDRLIRALEEDSEYRGQIAHVERVPGTAPTFAEPGHRVPEVLHGYLEREGHGRLYSHQAEIVDRFAAGEDLIIATPTGSGKTLGYLLAVGEQLATDPQGTALFVYPTKALSQDQFVRIEALDRACGLRASPAVYDGDTPQGARARIRRDSRVIITNPYALHQYLSDARGWQKFLSRLAVVVIDEAHWYRGVFGSHVALVVRRLERLCERMGSRPRFLLGTGTIANPDEHGAALVGRQVSVIRDSGAARSERAVVLWDSYKDQRYSTAFQAARILGALVREDQTTLCFCGSRRWAELISKWASEDVGGATVAAYRAGYLPAERRELERALRDGELQGLACTNALELGIDVGGLDAVVIAGYPGTVASTWQQIGRAGRAGQPSLSVLVAGNDPLDQYLVRRPSTLFGAPVERATVSLSNTNVLSGEVMCAAAELPVAAEESERFGKDLGEILAALQDGGLVSAGPAGYVFSGTFRPASVVSLDGRGDNGVELRCGGELVEVLDDHRAVREAYPGAVFLHHGLSYRVVSLDLDLRVADAEIDEAEEFTSAVVIRNTDIGDAEASREVGKWRLAIGPATVTEAVVGYKLRNRYETLAEFPLDLPPLDFETRAVWLSPSPGVLDSASAGLQALEDPLGALHAAEHALVHAMPLLAMSDRGDVGGMSSLAYSATGEPIVVLYDGFDGGAGLAEAMYLHFETLANLASSMIGSCDCEAGCPRCVYDRNCGSDNEPMDRLGAVSVLTAMTT